MIARNTYSKIALITVRIRLADDHKLFAMNLLITLRTAETLDVIVVPHRLSICDKKLKETNNYISSEYNEAIECLSTEQAESLVRIGCLHLKQIAFCQVHEYFALAG